MQRYPFAKKACYSLFRSFTSFPANYANDRIARGGGTKEIIPDEPTVSEYYDLQQQLEQMSNDFGAVITHPSYTLLTQLNSCCITI